jgi:hypothetical protein
MGATNWLSDRQINDLADGIHLSSGWHNICAARQPDNFTVLN